jgi:hypothetical protein
MPRTISITTGPLSTKDHHSFRLDLDNPVFEKRMLRPHQQEIKKHVIRHGESTNAGRTNDGGGGKLKRSVKFSDRVSVQFVPGYTNRMIFELFYSAEELTKFKDEAVIEESGLLESVSASAEPTFKVELLVVEGVLLPVNLPSPPGSRKLSLSGRQGSLLLQVAESPIAIREVFVESASAADHQSTTNTGAGEQRRPRAPRERRGTALVRTRSSRDFPAARRTDSTPAPRARCQSSLAGLPGGAPERRRRPESTSPVRPKRQDTPPQPLELPAPVW